MPYTTGYRPSGRERGFSGIVNWMESRKPSQRELTVDDYLIPPVWRPFEDGIPKLEREPFSGENSQVTQSYDPLLRDAQFQGNSSMADHAQHDFNPEGSFDRYGRPTGVTPGQYIPSSNPITQLGTQVGVAPGQDPTDDMRRLLEQFIGELGQDDPAFDRLRFQTRVGATDLMEPFGQKKKRPVNAYRSPGNTKEGAVGALELMREALRQIELSRPKDIPAREHTLYGHTYMAPAGSSVPGGEMTSKSKRRITRFGSAAAGGRISPRDYNNTLDQLQQLQTPQQRQPTKTKLNKRTKRKGDVIYTKETRKLPRNQRVPKQYPQKYSVDALRARGSGLRAGFSRQQQPEAEEQVSQSPELTAKAVANQPLPPPPVGNTDVNPEALEFQLKILQQMLPGLGLDAQ